MKTATRSAHCATCHNPESKPKQRYDCRGKGCKVPAKDSGRTHLGPKAKKASRAKANAKYWASAEARGTKRRRELRAPRPPPDPTPLACPRPKTPPPLFPREVDRPEVEVLQTPRRRSSAPPELLTLGSRPCTPPPPQKETKVAAPARVRPLGFGPPPCKRCDLRKKGLLKRRKEDPTKYIPLPHASDCSASQESFSATSHMEELNNSD